MPLPEAARAVSEKVRNWGRWGPDDERGTVNLIDAEARRRGIASAVTGEVFQLGMPWQFNGVQSGFIHGRTNPLHTMVAINEPSPFGGVFRTSDDTISMGLQAATHWDALAHCSYDGFLYNGFSDNTITASKGATRCGIDKLGPVVGRGILLDIAHLHGVEMLDGAHAITGDELDAAAEAARVDVQTGDIVLIRTGKQKHLRASPPDKLGYAFPNPGPSLASVEWFHRKGVAAIANDTLTFEALPISDMSLALCVHLLHLVDMGLTQGQNFVLDELANACHNDGRYTFLLEATPEPVVGGTGSPVQPVALR
jgi:kynurenine formamidase